MRFQIKKVAVFLLVTVPIVVLLYFAALNPPSVSAVPSYARQTGLACSGCHYNPPELNPAGRRFKLTGYVDRGDDTKVVKADGSKRTAPLDLLASLPLSVMFEASFTATKSPVPATQNGSFEFPQDFSLFLAGAWTSHIGSFFQATYESQGDNFSMDNTDIRYANKTKWGGKELVYGLDMNNNPTLDDLWNSTPAWGFPWIASDVAPTPNASAVINGPLAQDVAGVGAYAMWDSHLYFDLTGYRSEHIGSSQPNNGAGFGYNIRGVAPYWRLAWQQLSGKTQFEAGTYGMHMRSTPNEIVDAVTSASIPTDSFTDVGFDTQIDQTLFRKDVLSFRATYIRENNDLLCAVYQGLATEGSHRLNTVMTNAEYHYGNKLSGTLGWFTTTGTSDPLLFPQAPVTGNLNGDPHSTGYIANLSYWPWQNLQLGAQYTAYTRFNGGNINYDSANRNASANNTMYLDFKFLF